MYFHLWHLLAHLYLFFLVHLLLNMLFVNILRDADKIDIMTEWANEIRDNKIILKESILKSIYNKYL